MGGIRHGWCGGPALLWIALGVGTLRADPVIVDNADAGFSVISGTWNTGTAADQWGTDHRYKTTTTSGAAGSVEWRPNLPAGGDYIVSVWYPSRGSSAPDNAQYTVYHAGGSNTHTVNQQINGGQWVALGTFSFAAGTGGYVRLSDRARKNKTIAADAVRFEPAPPPAPEFRGMWADVFHPGFRTAAEVDQMIALALQGNYNAILPEVLAYHDVEVGSHGAFWRSSIVPQSSYVTGSFDPLGYLVQQAHAHGLEVHPWLVAFRCSTTWPPVQNPMLAAHPEWLMVPSGSIGTVASLGGTYTFDPGSPEVQDYLVSIVRELATRYEIDGIHWDYIRYTQKDAGYPADLDYAGSSLRRFQRITGRSDVPAYTGDAQWDDFRRRTITELVRRVRAELPTITSNPRQPLRYTAALVTWYPASTDFHQTRPYYDTYCDWEDWMQRGYLDASIPMAYFDEGTYPTTYRQWVDNSVVWAYARQTFIGPGIYMNTFADSLTQMSYARNAGAHGLCTYSYNVTNDGGAAWSDWYPFIAAGLFTSPVPTPAMPWRSAASATEGTLFGRVIDGQTGLPMDDAVVRVGALPEVRTDGAGWYVATLVPAAAGGTDYDVTVSAGGLGPVTYTGIRVPPGGVRRQDLTLNPRPATIVVDPPAFERAALYGRPPADDVFTVRNGGDGQLIYAIADDAEWLSTDPTSGTSTGEADAITIRYSTAGLLPGTHVATIEVSDPGASPPTATLTVTLRVSTPGDFDADLDVDQLDFSVLQNCLTGVSVPQDDPACRQARLDGDADVDADDVTLFLRCLRAPGVPADPACAG